MNRRIKCAICEDAINQATGEMFISHDGCEHLTHTKCMDVTDKEMACAVCEPDSRSGQISAEMKTKIEEPDLGAEDWVLCPVQKRKGLMKNISKAMWNDESDDPEDIKDPFKLVTFGPKVCPVEWLISKKKLGLAHFHAAGVDLVHFLDAGYNIQDLMKFKDIGLRGPKRGLRTLQTMGLNADLLIDYNDRLPIDVMREKFGLTPEKIASREMNGGIGFHPTQGLRTPGTDGWNLDHVIMLGFKFNDLVKIGLQTLSQWEKLEPTTEQSILLGVKQSDLNRLQVNHPYTEDDEEEEHSPVIMKTMMRVPSSQPIDIKTLSLHQELATKPRKQLLKKTRP
jgi:hypothetical protein